VKKEGIAKCGVIRDRDGGGGEFRLFCCFFVGGAKGRVGEEDLRSMETDGGMTHAALVMLVRAVSGQVERRRSSKATGRTRT
jgi:hypothetical protein